MLDGNLTKTVLKKNVDKKLEWDFNVPDSKKDILKILSQTVEGTILEYDVKETSFNAKIRVNANILYMPDSEEEPGIASLESTEMFVIKTEVPNNLAWDFVNVSLCLKDLTPVLINSRKVGVRSSANMDVKFLKNVTLPQIDCCDKPIETEIKHIESYYTEICTDDRIPVSLNLPLPSGKPSICELLKTDLCIRNKDLKPISNKAVLKGDLEVKILYLSTENTIETAEFVSPFTEIADVSGLNDEHAIIYDAKCFKNEVMVSEGDSQEYRNISINGFIELKINANLHVKENLVIDAYSPVCSEQIKKDILEYEEISDLKMDTVTIKEVVYFDDLTISEVINFMATPIVKKADINGNKIDISGKITANIFFKTENGIHAAQKDIDFTYLVDGFKKNDYDTALVNCELSNLSYNIAGSNCVEVRFTVALYNQLTKTNRMEYVSDINLDEDKKHTITRAPIVAYFVKENDSLFKIAKKYFTTVSKLKEINCIENENMVKTGQYLIIE